MDSPLIDQRFFTSAEAAQITGCSARQLQYWRQKDVVVPAVNATGTGRTVYYSLSDLLQLTTMRYLMSLGLTYEVCRQYLAVLKEADPEVFIHPEQSSVTQRFMLLQKKAQGRLELCSFSELDAVDAVTEGRAVIPIWPETLLQRLEDGLIAFGLKVTLLPRTIPAAQSRIFDDPSASPQQIWPKSIVEPKINVQRGVTWMIEPMEPEQSNNA